MVVIEKWKDGFLFDMLQVHDGGSQMRPRMIGVILYLFIECHRLCWCKDDTGYWQYCLDMVKFYFFISCDKWTANIPPLS